MRDAQDVFPRAPASRSRASYSTGPFERNAAHHENVPKENVAASQRAASRPSTTVVSVVDRDERFLLL